MVYAEIAFRLGIRVTTRRGSRLRADSDAPCRSPSQAQYFPLFIPWSRHGVALSPKMRQRAPQVGAAKPSAVKR